MRTIRTSIAAAFATVSVTGTVLLGQLVDSNRETLSIPIGSIFEIQAATTENAKVSWVLSEENEFIEASRESIFRTRFSREGDFALAVQVDTEQKTVQRVFDIRVRQRQAEDTMSPANPDDPIIFTPKLRQGSLPITNKAQVASFTPVRDDIRILAIDYDTQFDANGDGNAQNDEDTANTLFRSEGNPLYIWFVEGKKRTIRLGALYSDNTTSFRNIGIGVAPPKQEPTVESNSNDVEPEQEQEPEIVSSDTNMRIMILKNDNGTVQFSLRLPEGMEKPLLLYWNFGDGHNQMLDRPIHTYGKSGKYTVSVDVRDLSSGKVIETVTESIMVNRLQEADDPTETPDTTSKDSSGGSFLGTILKLLFSLLASAIVGAVVIFIIKKVRERGFSLEKSLQKAEEKLVKTPEETTSEAAPPLEITAEEVETPPVEDTPPATPPTEPVAPEPPQQEPVAETPTPPASEPFVEPPQPQPPAPPPIEQEPPAPEQTSAPAPEPFVEPPQKEPTAAPEATTPSWLSDAAETKPTTNKEPPEPVPPVPEPALEAATQPTPEPAEATPMRPVPETPVVDTPAPNVSHTALQPSAEQLEADKNNAPDWLQAGIEKAEESGQTASAPPPPTIAEEPQVPAPKEQPDATPEPLKQETPEPSPAPTQDDKAARERERKRKKRQRYRENLKKRKQEGQQEPPAPSASPEENQDVPTVKTENPDEPVAFITAEDIAPNTPTEQPEPPQPPQESPEIPPQEDEKNSA